MSDLLKHDYTEVIVDVLSLPKNADLIEWKTMNEAVYQGVYNEKEQIFIKPDGTFTTAYNAKAWRYLTQKEKNLYVATKAVFDMQKEGLTESEITQCLRWSKALYNAKRHV